MALTPNCTYSLNGVTVNEKIIPDGTVWKDDAKAKKAGFSGAGSLYKKNQKLSSGTGHVQSVTIHNTGDLDNVNDDGEQYTRATYNENMNSSRIHFYVDDLGAWQNLRAGTGLCKSDPAGSAEVSWHSGDGSTKDGGNMTSLSMEIIMSDTADHDAKAYDNGARIAAWLLWKNGLTVANLVTHTYWVNKSVGHKISDVDEQCTTLVSGKKWCPSYIFKSTNHATALKNWKAFKATVQKYIDALNGGTVVPVPENPEDTPASDFPFAVGDMVEFKSDAVKYNPASSNVPSWVKKGYTHIITQADSPKGSGKRVVKGGDTCVLLGRKVNRTTGKEEAGVNTWTSVNAVQKVEKTVSEVFQSYRVKITASALNIRKGPGTSYAIVGCIKDKGVYTIVAEDATGNWGKLKSGAGWIHLDYTSKL